MTWKKTFQIFSLVASVIALAYLVLSYYGYIREWGFKHKSIDSYITAYPSLPKADKNKVVVAFTCSESELGSLEPFIKSILDQSVRVDSFVIILPYKLVGKVPEKLKAVLTVHGYSKEYKDNSLGGNSVACLICSVLREPEAQTKIILVDPSTVYGFDFVQRMVEASNETPEKIIYGGGEGSHSENLKRGILIKPAFFNEDVTEPKEGSDCCEWLKRNSKVSERVIKDE